MGIVIRQSIKATTVSYIGTGLGAIIWLLIFPAFLPPSNIGLIEAIRGIATLLFPLASLGLPALIFRFFPFYQDASKQHHGFFSFIVIIFLAGFTITSALVLLFKKPLLGLFEENSPLLLDYFWYVLPLTFYTAFFYVLSAYSASFMRIVVPNLLNEVLYRILVLLLVLALAYNLLNFEAFAFFFLNSNALVILLLLLYIWQQKHLYLKFNPDFYTKEKWQQFGWYSLYNIIYQSSGYLINKLDIIMLGMMLGLRETGIYAIAFFIGNVIEIPSRSIIAITSPLIAQAHKEDNLAELDNLYKKTSINQMLVGLLLFLGIWMSIDPLFQFIPNGEVYAEGKWVVFFIGLGKVLSMLMGANGQIISLSRYYRFNLISTMALVGLIIATNLVFIPKHGIAGAAAASAIALFIFNLLNYTFLQLIYKIQPFTPATLKALAAAAITYGVVYFLPDIAHPLLQIIINSIVITALFGGMAFWWKISDDANNLVKEVWRRTF